MNSFAHIAMALPNANSATKLEKCAGAFSMLAGGSFPYYHKKKKKMDVSSASFNMTQNS